MSQFLWVEIWDLFRWITVPQGLSWDLSQAVVRAEIIINLTKIAESVCKLRWELTGMAFYLLSSKQTGMPPITCEQGYIQALDSSHLLS